MELFWVSRELSILGEQYLKNLQLLIIYLGHDYDVENEDKNTCTDDRL